MKSKGARVAGWMATVCAALILSACGGGGGGGNGTPMPPPTDARNGDYTLFAANAQEYTLSLDFNASTYHLGGTGVDQSGSISGSGNDFVFLPSNSTGASGTNTTRFSIANDTVIGAMGVGGTVLPFIAPRNFVTTAADAVGMYNLLSRGVRTDGAPDTAIEQIEVTADGHLRMCDDSTIYPLSLCPATSLTIGTLTVAGTQFRSDTPVGPILFRVARVGADNVVLRASVSPLASTLRRFWIAAPATSSFASGTFAGADTSASLDAFSFNVAASSATGTRTTPAGLGTQITFTTQAAGPGSLGSLLRMAGSDGGTYFAARGANFVVLGAAVGNTVAPGYVAIGRAQ